MRWQRTNEESLRIGIGKIKDLHPTLFDNVLSKALAAGISNSRAAEVFARSKVGVLKPLPRSKIEYWVERGHSNEEAQQEVIKRKVQLKKRQTKCTSPFARDHWTSKINPNTGKNYSIQEADFERNSRRPIRQEYWTSKGYPLEEATNLALNAKKQNDSVGAKRSALRSDLEKTSHTSGRTIQHWLIRGFSDEEAKDLVSNRQRTFTLKKLVQKHGAKEGHKLWADRQQKWQNTLKSKTIEEISRINKKKVSSGGISAAERKLFIALEPHFENLKTQITLRADDRKSFIFDLGVGQKLIEYNGDYWHANPAKYVSTDVIRVSNRLAEDIWKRDALKVQVAEEQGYNVLTIWESDFKSNPQQVINECIAFLTP